MSVSSIELEYSELAKRTFISSMHKSFATETFKETIDLLYSKNLINHKVYQIVVDNENLIQNEIDTFRDYNFDFFGIKTLEKSYLLKVYESDSKTIKVMETPQYLFMRVSLGIHKENLTEAFKTYHLLSQNFFTHASPTLFNSGTDRKSVV